MRRDRVLVGVPLVVAAALGAGGVASCGSRTGLLAETEPVGDGGLFDVAFQFDVDAGPDVPGIDVASDVHVINPCPDAAGTLIYVIGNNPARAGSTLYSFDPAAATFTPIGPIACPESGGSEPFSMAVDRQGVAYVVFSDVMNGQATGLYRVSTKTGSCSRTSFDPAATRGLTFGMGFVADVGDAGDGGETLFVSIDSAGDGVLASIDTTSFTVQEIGPFSPNIVSAELTGTGAGQLFAFQPGMEDGGVEGYIFQIDPTTGRAVGGDPVNVQAGVGWAFGFWGGDFYTFTAPGGTTAVNRFDPVSKTLSGVIATSGDVIVGAGVSTCAPQR